MLFGKLLVENSEIFSFINIDLEKSKMILRNKMVKEYKYATTSNRS